MYLRDLAIHLSPWAQLPEPWTERDFNLSTHAVVERYLRLLPRRTVVLGDLAKLNVTVGPRRKEQKRFWHCLGVGHYWWKNFDMEAYCAAARESQQKKLLTILHNSVIRVARRFHTSTTAFLAAKRALLAFEYPLPELPEEELRQGISLAKKKRRQSPAKARTTKRRNGPRT